MRKISVWIVFFAVIYLAALLTLMPARFAINDIAPKFGIELEKDWTFDNVSGRIWNGQFAGLAYQGTPIGLVGWELGFFRLLIGDVALHWSLETKNGALDGDVVIGPSGTFTLLDTQGDIAVSDLLQFFPYLPVPIDGTISTNISEIQMAGKRIKSIEGELLLQRAEIFYTEKVALGDIKLDVKTEGDDGLILADISNNGGDIAISSSATLNNNGKYQIKGSLEPVSKSARGLISMLSMFGKIERSGKLRINRSGVLYK
ncbi:MAG: type II secretion system protein GspN [Gammaproteobacteria bacterium]|nr:type II secretion system protein GspN [Gammaproteobacteria bacterium]